MRFVTRRITSCSESTITNRFNLPVANDLSALSKNLIDVMPNILANSLVVYVSLGNTNIDTLVPSVNEKYLKLKMSSASSFDKEYLLLIIAGSAKTVVHENNRAKNTAMILFISVAFVLSLPNL